MPMYEFRNKVTGEVTERLMSWSSREQYLKDNPDLEALVGAPPVIDPVRAGRVKPDSGFRDVLKEINSKHDKRLTRANINTF